MTFLFADAFKPLRDCCVPSHLSQPCLLEFRLEFHRVSPLVSLEPTQRKRNISCLNNPADPINEKNKVEGRKSELEEFLEITSLRKKGFIVKKTERQANIQSERQKIRKTERHMTKLQKDRKTERQKDRKTERQKDRKTERQKDRKRKNRRTERQIKQRR